MYINSPLNSLLGIRLPVIMAPMFLVSNESMMKAAIDAGIMGVFPTLNYRHHNELKEVISNLHQYRSSKGSKGSFGVNLIVQKTNPLFQKHLDICIAEKVPFFITSLGNPASVIERAHEYGARVFCDVTNLEHASKCAKLGCDGFIAVGQGAGGHAGPNPLQVLIPVLRQKFPDLPIIAAGGVATGEGILSTMVLGAAGVSIGTRFIATHEADVSDDYKTAVITSGLSDIIMTDRLSGTPCTIIDTPYARRIGYHQNWFEKMLSKNTTTKKYFKMLVQVKGMQKLEQAVKPGNYKNLWCAGKSVALVNEVLSCSQIIARLEKEMTEGWERMKTVVKE